jgi:tetratricopeptide (TPR) repeat protein
MEDADGVDERVRQAELLYERAVFTGDASSLAEASRELDAAEADLVLARGRLLHARFLLRRDQAAADEDPAELPLFERAAELYRALGDTGGEADALFWIGCFHQQIRRDDATATVLLEQSLKLSSQAGHKAAMAEAMRHLGIAAHRSGRLELARRWLEDSTRLRREIGLLPGAAANMVGLAYIAAAQERRDDALALLDEASAIATATEAHRILQQVNEARSEVLAQRTTGPPDLPCQGAPNGRSSAAR